MTTVIRTPRSIDAAGLAGLNEDRAAAEIVQRMENRFPDTVFLGVPGGEASEQWNLLVRDYSIPTPEQERALRQITESVICDDVYES